jgi:DNA-binding FadR family transcriptional regulator
MFPIFAQTATHRQEQLPIFVLSALLPGGAFCGRSDRPDAQLNESEFNQLLRRTKLRVNRSRPGYHNNGQQSDPNQTYQPHKGARLLVPTGEWVREIFQIREALEGIAAREAAVKIQKTQLKVIRAKSNGLRPRVLAGDISNVGGFIHEEVFAASGNERLQRLMSPYLAQVRWFQSMAAIFQGAKSGHFGNTMVS